MLVERGRWAKISFQEHKILMIHLDATKKVKLGLMRCLRRSMHCVRGEWPISGPQNPIEVKRENQLSPNVVFWPPCICWYTHTRHANRRHPPHIHKWNLYLMKNQTFTDVPSYENTYKICIYVHILYMHIYIHIYPQFHLLPYLQVIKIKTFN